MAWGFANEVRKVMQRLSHDHAEISVSEIAREMGLLSDKEKRPLYNTLDDFRKKSQEIERVRTGVYEYTGKNQSEKPRISTRMWRFLKMNRKASAEDLQEIAGASHEYAKEWLQSLARQGIVKRTNSGSYRLIKLEPEEPENEQKKEKLKKLRIRRKREAMAALAAAGLAIQKARQAIDEME